MFESAWYALHHAGAHDFLAFSYAMGTATVVFAVARSRATGKKPTRAGLWWGSVALLSAALSLVFRLQSGELTLLSWSLYVLAGGLLGALLVTLDRNAERRKSERRPDDEGESLLAPGRSNV